MTAFRVRMAEFSTLCEMVQKSEEELKKHMEDLNSLKSSSGLNGSLKSVWST